MIRESISKQARLNELFGVDDIDLSDPMGTVQRGMGKAQQMASDMTGGKMPQMPDILNPMNMGDLIDMRPEKLGNILNRIPGGKLPGPILDQNPSILLKIIELVPGIGPYVESLEDAMGDEFEDYAAEVLEEAYQKCTSVSGRSARKALMAWDIKKLVEIDYKCVTAIAREKATKRANARTAIRIMNDAFGGKVPSTPGYFGR